MTAIRVGGRLGERTGRGLCATGARIVHWQCDWSKCSLHSDVFGRYALIELLKRLFFGVLRWRWIVLKGLNKKLRNYCSGMFSQQFPINRMIGKNLGKSSSMPHAALLKSYDAFGRDGFDWKETSYYKTLVCTDRALTENFSELPDNMTFPPEWWVMPWAAIPGRERGGKGRDMEVRAQKKISDFFDVYESVKSNGYIPTKGGAIKGYSLIHPEYGEIFNYIDGHHRMAILNHLAEHHGFSDMTAGVISLGRIMRNELDSKSSFVEGVSNNKFSYDDAYRLFDHCFIELGLADRVAQANHPRRKNRE